MSWGVSMKNLIFLKAQYDKIHAHLFPGDGLEALSVCLATQVKHKGGVRFLVNDVYNIPHDECERDSDYLTWKTSSLAHILDKAAKEKKAIIKIHSHPKGPRAFSKQDNVSDFGLFPSIFEWCDHQTDHCSVVFTDDYIVGRVFDSMNTAHVIENVWVIGESLRLYQAKHAYKSATGFDESTYEVFRDIKVGVVGCSGTGGWVCELLGRNEIGRLFLSDFDILKNKNLNRIVNAKAHLCGKNKAEVAAEAIRDMKLGTNVTWSSLPIQNREVIEQLKSCDVIFGCVDSVFARHLLNMLCAYYMIPYFDVGVHIATGSDTIKAAVAGFDYVFPGGSSLQTRGIFTADELAAETFELFSPDLSQRLRHEGYIRGQVVGRPAVSAINTVGASHCFEEFQAQVLSYRYDPSDAIASMVFCAKSRELITKKENRFEVDQLLRKVVGKGDLFFREQAHLLLSEQSEIQP